MARRENPDLVREICEILLEFLPGYAVPKGIIRLALKYLPTGHKNALVAIDAIATEVHDALYHSEGLDRGNPGAAKAASFDVVKIIRGASVSPRLVVDCSLAAEALSAVILNHGSDVMSQASGIRRTLIRHGVEAFSQKLIENYDRLPGIRYEMERRLLETANMMRTESRTRQGPSNQPAAPDGGSKRLE